MLFSKSEFLLVLVLCWKTLVVHASNIVQRETNDGIITSLTAVTVRSELEKRQPDFTPKHACEHHYADREYSHSRPINRTIAEN